jgi:hypothetical protein
LQQSIEGIRSDISSKRKIAALDGVKKSKSTLGNTKQVNNMLASCRSSTICQETIQQLQAELDPLAISVKASQDSATGSLQEKEALDNAYNSQVSLAKLLTKLEEQMVPDGYVTPVPQEYSDLPQLQKRATVEMLITKGAGSESSQFDVNGVNYPQAKLVMVIDGYTGTSYLLITTLIRLFYTK